MHALKHPQTYLGHPAPQPRDTPLRHLLVHLRGPRQHLLILRDAHHLCTVGQGMAGSGGRVESSRGWISSAPDRASHNVLPRPCKHRLNIHVHAPQSAPWCRPAAPSAAPRRRPAEGPKALRWRPPRPPASVLPPLLPLLLLRCCCCLMVVVAVMMAAAPVPPRPRARLPLPCAAKAVGRGKRHRRVQ